MLTLKQEKKKKEDKRQGTKGLFGWDDRKVRGQKIQGGWKSGGIEKFLIFLICVWLRE